jgi:DNA-binding MarR family transcriptional regulator
MSRRVPAKHRRLRLLSKFVSRVDRARLPRFGAALLLYISAEPEGRGSYAKARTECKVSRVQMASAVRALAEKRLIVKSDDDQDARVKWLTITTDGQRIVDELTGTGS